MSIFFVKASLSWGFLLLIAKSILTHIWLCWWSIVLLNLSFQYRSYVFQFSKMCLYPSFINQVDFLLETSPSISVPLVRLIKSFILTSFLPLWISFFTDSTSKFLSRLHGSWSSHSTSAEEYSYRLGKEKIQGTHKLPLKTTDQKITKYSQRVEDGLGV